MLELEDGVTCICESISIARFMSNNKYNFYGPDSANRALTDMWIDIINMQIGPTIKDLNNI